MSLSSPTLGYLPSTSIYSLPAQLFEEGGNTIDNNATRQDSAWSQVVTELQRIRKLPNDWDGEGSDAPNPALVDWAITLAQELQAQGVLPSDRVHLSVNGTIYFEWHTQLGYCEIEVISPDKAECRSVQNETEKTEVMVLSPRSELLIKVSE